MLERLFQNDYSPIDFSFVYQLKEEDLNMFFDVTDFAIESIVDIIKESQVYVNQLPLAQAKEVVAYFYRLLDLYTDYELYEECDDIVFVINTLEGHVKIMEEKVGNMN